MRNQDKRLKRLEQKAPVERKFIGWKGNPWTEEQKAEAIRREPDRLIFWRSLLEVSEEVIEKAAEKGQEGNGIGDGKRD